MEQQIIEAAVLIISPKTSSEQRQAASKNLELWLSSLSKSIFECYTNLLHILFFTDLVERIVTTTTTTTISNNTNVIGVKLLFLSMLHNKCRRISNSNGSNNSNGEEELVLRNLLEKVYSCLNTCTDASLSIQLCSVTAAVAVRKGGVKELIFHSTSSSSTTTQFGYRLLISLAQEIEIIQTATTTTTTFEKEILSQDVIMTILQKVYNGIVTGNVLALQVLSKWVPILSITLSQLLEYNNTTTSSTTTVNYQQQQHQSNLLLLLIQILSNNNNNNALTEQMVIHTSNAITESLLISKDCGTTSRTQSISLLLESIPKLAFIVSPFTSITYKDNDDVVHALSNLACNLAIEEVDVVTKCQNVGCTELIELLFHIQMHSHGAVSMPVLDVWLAFQDIPISERHESMTYPLFSRLLDILVQRMSYPVQFISWDEDYDDEELLDSSEFEQFRKLVGDVLISIYFLLRGNFLNQLVQTIATSSSTTPTNIPAWNVLESTLFCLTCISSEVHTRLKSSVRLRSVVEDCTITSRVLLSILEMFCFSEQQQQHSNTSNNNMNLVIKQHPLLLLSLVTFTGNYALVWNICEDINSNSILQILSFLGAADPKVIDASSKAIKSVFVTCSSKLVILDLKTVILPILVHFMQQVVVTISRTATTITDNQQKKGHNNNLSSIHASSDSISNITEGVIRLLVQYHNNAMLNQALISVTSPVLQKSHEALNYIQTKKGSTDMEIACNILERYLRVIQVIIKFCEIPSSNNNQDTNPNLQHPLTDLFSTLLWPFLSTAIPICRQHATLFAQILNVNGQILSSVPQLISPYISELITFVVQSYEEMFYPSALDFIATTLESSCLQGSSSSSEHQFSLLLSHILQCTCYYVTSLKHPTECPLLIFSFFDLCKRFLCFSPNVLYHCTDLPTLFSFAVACLTECRGEIESTRATLNFLNRIMIMPSSSTHQHGIRGSSTSDDATSIIEPLVLKDGQVITKCCITGLAGYMTQILHPSLADCLVSLLSFTVLRNTNNNVHPVTSLDYGSNNTNTTIPIIYQWISSSLHEINIIESNDKLIKITFLKIVFTMLEKNQQQQGNSNNIKSTRPLMKMLFMDFSKICKGEMSLDCILSYSLKEDTT